MDLKARFMDFKQRNYVDNFSNYQSLAQRQTPKFMVVACADSRVCPAVVLGFQPGEAFIVRNVANLLIIDDKDEKLVSLKEQLGEARCTRP
ncbi:beta carbonic anhydrase 5, chloroplastic-like [Miscanthus floridulus]|uniref:beta carbonic anhydrase 5, chloroplastic-like n=1 Tax=Miscanthus floridulus TaxID=154761 RepID=UPI003458D6A5